MGRLNQSESNPFAPPDTGRKFYREPGEPKDERPTLLIRRFWESPEEEAAYLSAVRDNARKPGEGAFAYIVRLAGIVQQGPLARPAKAFPPPPRLNREYSGPRPTVTEGGLSFEDRTDAIYDTEGGREG